MRKKVVCGKEHPTRDGVKCWETDPDHEQHWAYIPIAHGSTTKVTWRLYDE